MRYTWPQIQQMYPDQWVLVKEPKYIKGNLQSAVVLHACKDRWDINRFEDENPDKVQCFAAVKYTGEIFEGVEYNDDDIYVDVELSDVF